MALIEQTDPPQGVERIECNPVLLFAPLAASIFIVMAFSSVPSALIAAIIIVWLGGGFAVRWDPLHPYTIFGTGMMLYAIAAPLLSEFDLFPRPLYRAADALQILYVSFTVVYLVIWPTRLSMTRVREIDPSPFLAGAKVVIAIFLPLCALSSLSPFLGDLATKETIVSEGGILARLSYFSALNIGVSLLLLHAIWQKQISTAWRIFLPFAVFYFLVIGFAGQRYGIYYLCITAFIVFAAFYRVRFRALATIGVTALALNTLLGGLKLFITASLMGQDVVQSTLDFYGTDDFNYWLAYEGILSRTFKTILLTLLGSEPTTVADNLNTLLDLVPSTYPYRFGSAALGDLGRAFSLGFLQDTATGIGATAQNSGFLFNSWVQLEGLLDGSGVGFCLICTGYLDFGSVGAIIISVLLGLALRESYRWAAGSAIGLIFYANLIPIAMTSLRQDLSQIISTPLKQLFVPLLIIWLTVLFGRKRQI